MPLRLPLVAQDLDHAADAEREGDQRVAHHDAGATTEVGPRRLHRHAREEPREDEREQRDAERDRKLPAEGAGHTEVAHVCVRVALHAHPVADEDRTANQERREQHAEHRHEHRVHEVEALPRHARVVVGEQPPRLVHARARVELEALQALQAVLVEGHDQPQPDNEAGEGPCRRHHRRGVVGRLPEDQEQERDRKLGKQAGGGNARGPLIGMVVDTHRWLQAGCGLWSRVRCARGAGPDREWEK